MYKQTHEQSAVEWLEHDSMSEGSRKQFIGLSLFLEKTMRLSDCYLCYRNFMFIIKTENGSNKNNKTNVILLLRT